MSGLLRSRFLHRSATKYLSRSRQSTARFFSATSSQNSSSNPFQTGPAPPRLPKEEQEIFEKLQQQSRGAFSTPQSTPEAAAAQQAESNPENGEELHPDLRGGAKPEFEGDKNPKTGEVGGPKNEPLRWGAGGDWSFNGRVTDF